LANKKYKEPNIIINKVYTRTGDSGKTMLVGGQKIFKDDLRICSYGQVDELNSYIGAARESLKGIHNNFKPRLLNDLKRIQNELFNIGNMLATLQEDVTSTMPRIEHSHIQLLENDIDFYNKDLPPLSSFVLPGGSIENTWLHISRTFCRKCERTIVKLFKEENIDILVVKYLNRLSDFLFVLSRYVNFIQSVDENLWEPNKR
tara:strand:- start:113 stop:721 length:609 start_codon:yes stop_codon:yes gene_type:complete